ncbi:hypothetical protein DUNSADRAFT_8580 [Dunaliella salina]|uniref:F-box domain-containing protein n=1 Tax=Dunaliella salina TaxID=3046 RepID=A0ABQ7GJ80_DUNSA|nr:hypothetical protein DUNSADRAFT_8580 [Dunaliella salina]|eukprot:KAF5834656.1 hypothetical protein DUNSADRAFT_8580 [Dunaliella salina]
MASLHSLPEHLVGQLYSLLPDKDSKKAFYASSKSVCDAPSVLHQISKLIVTEAQLDATEREGPFSNPLLTFPRKATLRHLLFKYGKSNIESDPPIMSTLHPEPENLRLRVQALFRDVEVLQFEVYLSGQNKAACHRLGEFLRMHATSLHTLQLPYETFPPAFLQALSAFDGGRKIQRMEMRDVDEGHLQALRHFTGLKFLKLFDVTEDDELRQLKLMLAELRQLKT